MMFPKYPSIIGMHRKDSEPVLEGVVEVTEKLDGSNGRMMFSDDLKHGYKVGSREVDDKLEKYIGFKTEDMFNKLVELAGAIYRDGRWREIGKHVLFIGEYFETEKQNTLIYNRMPKNGFYLFSVAVYNEEIGEWKHLNTGDIIRIADMFELESPNILHVGEITLKELEDLITESVLGGVTMEGVVIKNYTKTHPYSETRFPYTCKLVRDSFKEHNNKEWKEKKDKKVNYVGLQEGLSKAYITENRVKKAIQKLREKEGREAEIADTGTIIKAVFADILAEEGNEIKEEAFKMVYADFVKSNNRNVVKIFHGMLGDDRKGYILKPTI